MKLQPQPWSFSSLSTYVTCPRKYWAQYVGKTLVKSPPTPAQQYGTETHKHFEDRLAVGRQLPEHLAQHEPLMQEIEKPFPEPGKRSVIYTERKVGINRKLEPTGFYDADVWWRGVIDVQKVNPDGTATIVDYKTGKVKNEMRQLWLFSMYGFLTGSHTVEALYYWTETKTRTRVVLPAVHLPTILNGLVPDLTAYKQSFRDDTWPPTPNGLCQKYCDVVGCEFRGKAQQTRRF
jgi:CRISPR/Cas system-associated exonuclease Cas4 (RecB family)